MFDFKDFCCCWKFLVSVGLPPYVQSQIWIETRWKPADYKFFYPLFLSTLLRWDVQRKWFIKNQYPTYLNIITWPMLNKSRCTQSYSTIIKIFSFVWDTLKQNWISLWLWNMTEYILIYLAWAMLWCYDNTRSVQKVWRLKYIWHSCISLALSPTQHPLSSLHLCSGETVEPHDI